MTRVVEIRDARLLPTGSQARVFTSLEGENPSGSLKDHLVAAELAERVAEGRLQPGAWVAELSAGNTARSLAWFARRHGLKSALFVPDYLPVDELADLRAVADEVHTGNPAQGFGPYVEFLRERGAHPLNQFTDATLERHYVPIGAGFGVEVDAVVGAVGTGHSLRGIARGLGAPSVTAEPTHPLVPGIRNLDLHRNGPADPCVPAWFDRRIVLDDAAFFGDDRIETDVGPVAIGPSFRLVLGAVARLLAERPSARIFALGATNHRVATR